MLLQYNTDNIPLRKRGSATSAEVATAAAAAAVTAAAAAAANARGSGLPRAACKRKRQEDEKGSSASPVVPQQKSSPSLKNQQRAQQQQQERQEQLTILTGHFGPSSGSVEEFLGLDAHVKVEEELQNWDDADAAQLYSPGDDWVPEHGNESCSSNPAFGQTGIRIAVSEVLEADWINSISQDHPMKEESHQETGSLSPMLSPTGFQESFIDIAPDFTHTTFEF